jgi:pimeloyl-ACP methyl ester carboxylesterase
VLSQFPAYHGEDRAALMQDLATVGGSGFIAHIRAHFTYDVRDQLESIKAPTLLLAGNDDRLTRSGEPQKLQAHLKHAQIAFVANAGHVTFLRQPDLFYETVLTFLLTKATRLAPELVAF